MREPLLPSESPGIPVTRSTVTAGSGASPRTNTFTLPLTGIYDVTVVALVNGSRDHMLTGQWRVVYENQTNDTLLSTAIGAIAKSTGSTFTLDTLTLSNPDAAGVVTATASWGDGVNYAVIFKFTARMVAGT